MSRDKLHGDGLKIYQECWVSMLQHWSDFGKSSDTRNEEWTSLLNNFKEEVIVVRIEEMRQEIEKLWDQCYISELKRKQSIINNKEVNLEISLMKHRDELLNIRDYLSKNKELIDLVKKYEDFLTILDSPREESPDERLKKNRGAVLLKEEQRRKLLLQVPKLQKTILKHIKQRELGGFTFLIRGENFEDIMERNNKKYFLRKSLSASHGNVAPSSSSSSLSRRFSADISKFKTVLSLSDSKVQRSTSMKL